MTNQDRFKFRVFLKDYGMSTIFDLNHEPVFPLYGATNWSWPEQGGIVMQSTGLHDTNKILMFDGDIVKAKSCPHDKEVIARIDWLQNECCFGLEFGYKNSFGNLSYWVPTQKDIEEYEAYIEVIGNKFQQPHLLQKDE